MATKKQGSACKVPTGRKPTRKQYTKRMVEIVKASVGIGPTTASATAWQSPHNWPPYGGECYVQAWAEMRAWETLCTAAKKYTAALDAKARGQYMPDKVIEDLLRAYMTAISDYNAAWYAMDVCVNGGVPV